MTDAAKRSAARLRSSAYAWLPTALALLAGLLAAVEPPLTVATAFGAATLALLALITPIAALVLLLVVAPLRTLVATEAQYPLPLDVGQIALLFALAAWLLHQLVQRRSPLAGVWTPIYLPVGLFVLVTAISGFGAVSFGAWASEWLKWVQILLLVAVVMQLGAADRWRWIVFGLTAAGVANALVGIYEFFGGSGALHLLVNERYFRAFGTFGQPNPFGGFMGLIAPLALASALGYALSAWRSFQHQRAVKRSDLLAALYFGLCGGIMAVALVMSWSRGAWLAFALAMAAVLFALPRRVWHSVALVAVAATIVGGLWLSGQLPTSITARVASATQELFAFDDVRGVDISPENYAVVERLAHWQAALNMARERPWTGVGFGNYEAAYPQFRLINWKFALGHAHNYYLNVLAEAGMIGLVAYGLLWIVVIFLTWRIRRHPHAIARLTAAGLLGTWVYLLVHSLTDNLYVNNLFLHIGVMLGIVAKLYSETWSGVTLRMR